MEGSPTDALVFQVLLICGWLVLALRGSRPLSLMTKNWPIVLYFLYCLVSVTWSDYPAVAIKRWFKATGDVVMALVVVTDPQPRAALRRLFSRLGFVLLPASVLLIKYYPHLGKHFSQWTGQQWNGGVTTNKNLLGLTTYVLMLGALWQILRLSREVALQSRFRQLVAQCALLVFGVRLLSDADSATSTACFMLAAGLMLVIRLERMRRRPGAVNVVVLTLVLLGGLSKLTGVDGVVVDALGRNPDLTGRASEVWPLLIPMAPNALGGAGFESFWLGPRLQTVWDAMPNLYVNEAHNGYIEVYLNLGLIGLGLLIVLVIHGYGRAVAAFRIDQNVGGMMVAYVVSAMMYSYTEAGFRLLNYSWSFLVLIIIGASRISEVTAETQVNSALPKSAQGSAKSVQT
ncbi:MAG: O-antigen ligase family protein [Bryobacteraceae bacterium]